MTWIITLIVGAIAGWIAEKVMKSDQGLLTNIILGIIGAFIVNAILRAMGVFTGDQGWIGYLIAGVVGACILIALGRLLRRKT